MLKKLSPIVLAVVVAGCTDSEPIESAEEKMARKIEDVLHENTDRLMAIEGVVGVGQGLCDESDCIKVFIISQTAELEAALPDSIDGYAVEIVVTGEIKALEEE